QHHRRRTHAASVARGPDSAGRAYGRARGGRHHTRRPRHHAGRQGTGPQRDHSPPLGNRVRSARCRSAPRKATARAQNPARRKTRYMSRADLPPALLFTGAGPLAPLQGWAAWTSSLRGWRRHLYAILMGAIAAAALPPVDLTPLLVVSFTSLIWLSDATMRRGGAFF